jgi:Tfp pilus assembly protein PilW
MLTGPVLELLAAMAIAVVVIVAILHFITRHDRDRR